MHCMQEACTPCLTAVINLNSMHSMLNCLRSVLLLSRKKVNNVIPGRRKTRVMIGETLFDKTVDVTIDSGAPDNFCGSLLT